MSEQFEPEDLIQQAIGRYGKHIAIACSFGKDSITILHMALKYDSNILVLFNNTKCEFPETIKYKNMLKELWNLNLIEVPPLKTFWQCITEYGLPTVRKSGGKGSNSPKCCYYLKEKPAMLSYKKYGIIAILTGITADENINRKLLIARYNGSNQEKDEVRFCGQRYYAKTQGLWKYHPIAYWTEKDVWNYIKRNNIPINPVYTKWNGIYNRCGCLPCTAYLDWEKKLPKSHPKLYRKLKRIQNPEQTMLKGVDS